MLDIRPACAPYQAAGGSMKLKILGTAVAVLVLCTGAAPKPKSDLPPPANFLFWTPAQQAIGYRSIEKIFPTRVVKRGPTVSALPRGTKPFDVSYKFRGKMWNTAAVMQANSMSGLLIIKNGHIVLERYGLGRKPADRWTSFSVAKSITSSLFGAAIQMGYIKSVDDPMTRYMPELKGTAYDGVTIRDLITMRSGVKWNENYSDPKSDVNQFGIQTGKNPVESYMMKLPRAHKPGTTFSYNTGETDLAGILVARATHMHLADFLSKAVWSKIGAEEDAVWMLDQGGNELGGCCISMTLRDYGRFGLMFLNNGKANGSQIIPAGWVAQSTRKQTKGFSKFDYGYFWWIHPDGTYEAIGIFGQSIVIDPKDNLVIVANSALPQADATKYYEVHDAYVAAVEKALR
jgi:CubicO group peptidase (beta-lactamase class C family)